MASRADLEISRTWISYAATLFPPFAAWFDRLPVDGPSMSTQSNFVDGCLRLFRGLMLEELKAATDEISMRDDEPRPTELSRQVARLVRKKHDDQVRRPAYDPNGEQKVGCIECEDSGRIQIVDTRDFARANRGEQGAVHNACRKCRCRRGQRIGDHLHNPQPDDVLWGEFRELRAKHPSRSGLDVLRDLLYDRHGELAAGEAVVGRFSEFDT